MADKTCADCRYWQTVPHNLYDPSTWDAKPDCRAPERLSPYARFYTPAGCPACDHFKDKEG